MKVNEIFYSIQGESSYAGQPCLFIRLTGCNLRCNYCDTTYAFDKGEEMSIDAVLQILQQYRCTLVEMTGGEPLLQSEAFELTDSLLQAGYTVLIESNGTQDISRLPAGVRVIMDIKCPGSGVHEAMDWQNIHRLRPEDEVKFVLSDRADYTWAKEIISRHKLQEAHPVLFSAVQGRLTPAELASWILEDQLAVRLQLQLHKIIWPHDEQGR